MAQHSTDTDSIPTHIEALSWLKGALAYSPGNQDLVGAVEAAIKQLQGVQQGQNLAADAEHELRGADHMVLVLIDPVVRELEKLETAFVASPAGKTWTAVFTTSAANILGKAKQDDRDAALLAIDQAVTRADCPPLFKDAGKRYHDLYKKHAALLGQREKNDGRQTDNRAAAAAAKQGSTSVSNETEGHLKARSHGDQKFADAHFKPASPKKKKDDPKLEELQKKVNDLTVQVTALESEKKAATDLALQLQLKNGELQRQLDDSLATAATYRQQLADLSSQAASATAKDAGATPGT